MAAAGWATLGDLVALKSDADLDIKELKGLRLKNWCDRTGWQDFFDTYWRLNGQPNDVWL